MMKEYKKYTFLAGYLSFAWIMIYWKWCNCSGWCIRSVKANLSSASSSCIHARQLSFFWDSNHFLQREFLTVLDSNHLQFRSYETYAWNDSLLVPSSTLLYPGVHCSFFVSRYSLRCNILSQGGRSYVRILSICKNQHYHSIFRYPWWQSTAQACLPFPIFKRMLHTISWCHRS